jgi:hypothetical protein
MMREILGTSLADNRKARFLRADGTYRYARPLKSEPPFRSQGEFIRLARNNHASGLPRRSARPSKYPPVKLAPRPKALGAPKSSRGIQG